MIKLPVRVLSLAPIPHLGCPKGKYSSYIVVATDTKHTVTHKREHNKALLSTGTIKLYYIHYFIPINTSQVPKELALALFMYLLACLTKQLYINPDKLRVIMKVL